MAGNNLANLDKAQWIVFFYVWNDLLPQEPKIQTFFKNSSIHRRGHTKFFKGWIKALHRPDLARGPYISNACYIALKNYCKILKHCFVDQNICMDCFWRNHERNH